MTYADRGTLADRLAAGPLPVPPRLQYGADVARGLAVLHPVGVIHRDVNPANVLIRSGRDGIGERVLVADLGLAKAAAHGSGSRLTVGTPGYLAPEQVRPAHAPLDARPTSTRSARCCTISSPAQHLPSTGPSRHRRCPLRPEVPASVDAVVRQAIGVRPEDRFPSAVALADAIDASVGLAASRRPAVPPATRLRADERQRPPPESQRPSSPPTGDRGRSRPPPLARRPAGGSPSPSRPGWTTPSNCGGRGAGAGEAGPRRWSRWSWFCSPAALLPRWWPEPGRPRRSPSPARRAGSASPSPPPGAARCRTPAGT